MELRQFFKIVRRSWLLVVGLPLLVLLLSLATLRLPPQRYHLTAKIAVTQSQITPRSSSDPDFNSYHSWAASEYIVDDLGEILASAAFANDLQAWLRTERGLDVATSDLQSGLTTSRVHRVVMVQVRAASPEIARAMAEGVAALLEERGLAYWERQEHGELAVSLLEITPATAENRWRQPAWTVVLRVILGLAAGIFLAFLRHALDTTIRDEDDLQAIGLNLVGAIPSPPADTQTSPRHSARRPRDSTLETH